MFSAGWLEALGDLDHYCMAIAVTVTSMQGPRPDKLTTAMIFTVWSASPPSVLPSSATDHLSNISAESSLTYKKPKAGSQSHLCLQQTSLFYFTRCKCPAHTFR